MKKDLTEKGVFNVSNATGRLSKMRTNLYVQQLWAMTLTSELEREWKEGEELKDHSFLEFCCRGTRKWSSSWPGR